MQPNIGNTFFKKASIYSKYSVNIYYVPGPCKILGS